MGASGSRGGRGGDDAAVVDIGRGRVKLAIAHRQLRIIDSALMRRAADVTSIDATANELSSLGWIRDFPQLEELVLDGNRVTHKTHFPPHASLRLLSLNGCRLGERDVTGDGGRGGTVVIERIAKAFPRLTYLSLLNNPGVPSYFNGSSAAECSAFRRFVLSRLPGLRFLDGSVVTEVQLDDADDMFGLSTAANSLSPYGWGVASPATPGSAEVRLSGSAASGLGGSERRERRRSGRRGSAPAEPLPCPHCSASLLLQNAQPGSRWPCAKCNAIVEVPAAGDRRSGGSGSGGRLSGGVAPPPLPPPRSPPRGLGSSPLQRGASPTMSSPRSVPPPLLQRPPDMNPPGLPPGSPLGAGPPMMPPFMPPLRSGVGAPPPPPPPPPPPAPPAPPAPPLPPPPPDFASSRSPDFASRASPPPQVGSPVEGRGPVASAAAEEGPLLG